MASRRVYRLARYLRFLFLGKKRGARRTGSERLGSAALLVFFAALLVIGCGLLISILREFVVPEWRLNQAYVAARCEVTDGSVERVRFDEVVYFRPQVRVRYEVEGRTLEPWIYLDERPYVDRPYAGAALAQYDVGRKLTCWYDPANPSHAVLRRGYTWFPWLMLLLPISFLSFGGGGVIYTLLGWGKSAERMAALHPRGHELFPATSRHGRPEFPGIPDPAPMTDSEGTTLAYRLPAAASSLWTLLLLGAFCLVVNGMGLFFLVMALSRAQGGEGDWRLTLFAVALLAIGLGALWALLRHVWRTTGVGPSIVEVSDHPLCAGNRYDLYFSQGGKLTVNWLSIALVCEEKASFRQGTDTRTERRFVHEDELFLREGFRIQPQRPLEIRCSLQLADDCMHSFRAECNEVNWALRVAGEVAGAGTFERLFPLVVYPHAAAGHTELGGNGRREAS